MTGRLALALALLVAFAPPVYSSHRLSLHWVNRESRPTIFLVDATNGRFPVREAADRWNQGGASHFKLSSSCPPNRGCTVVQLRAMRYLGLTRLYHDRTHLQRAEIDLSSTRRMSPAKRLSVTCHEMGHALGLGHRLATSSCMYNANAFPLRPDRHDYDALRAQYTHVH